MSAPVILSTLPALNETGVALGRTVEIFFDQPMDPTTVTNATFSLTGPGSASVYDPNLMLHRVPKPLTGREYITGTFTWPSTDHLVFTPSKPLRPGVSYTVLIVGQSSTLATQFVANPAGQAMAVSSQWTFETGEINAPVLPAPSPIAPSVPWMRPRLSPKSINVQLLPSDGSGNRTVVMTFPAAIDTANFDVNSIIVAAEALLNDPMTPLPSGVTTTITSEGNTIQIVLNNIESAG